MIISFAYELCLEINAKAAVNEIVMGDNIYQNIRFLTTFVIFLKLMDSHQHSNIFMMYIMKVIEDRRM